MKKVALMVLGAVVVTGVITWCLIRTTTPRVGYVDLQELYASFEMRKELEAKYSNIKNQRMAILDSLKLEIEMLGRSIESGGAKEEVKINEFQMKRQEFMAKQQQFEEDNVRAAGSYSDQVWKQINEYVKEYGENNGFSIIHGASGDGAIMYAQPEYNVTKEVSAFVNERYNGKK